MEKGAQPRNIDDLISDFSRFYILTILYEGPAHGHSIISQFHNVLKKKAAQAWSTLPATTRRKRISHTYRKTSWRERAKKSLS